MVSRYHNPGQGGILIVFRYQGTRARAEILMVSRYRNPGEGGNPYNVYRYPHDPGNGKNLESEFFLFSSAKFWQEKDFFLLFYGK